MDEESDNKSNNKSEPLRLSCALECAMHDLMRDVMYDLGTSSVRDDHPEEFSYVAMKDQIHDYAMIMYMLDEKKGIEYWRAANTITNMSMSMSLIRQRAVAYATYHASAKLWSYIIEVAKAKGLTDEDAGIRSALCTLLGHMAGAMRSVPADPLLSVIDEDVRDALENALGDQIHAAHYAVVHEKVMAGRATFEAYLRGGDLEKFPTPIPCINLEIDGVSPRELPKGVSVVKAAMESAEVKQCLRGYLESALKIISERGLVNVPAAGIWMPIHTFCESNEGRAQLAHWMARIIRRGSSGRRKTKPSTSSKQNRRRIAV